MRTAQPPRPLTREEVREVDRRAIEELGVPGVVLMENAGRGLAEAIARRGGVPTIVCGTGNNGGDGWVAARHLRLAGVTPRLILCGARERVGGDAAINLGVLERVGVDYALAPDGPALAALLAEQPPELLVDALYGTGLQGELRPDGRAWVEALVACGAPVLAVDIPSGLCADSGRPLGVAVRAERTVTFVAPKAGFAAAADYVGEVEVVAIGCPAAAWSFVS